jgi:hypothetical protein
MRRAPPGRPWGHRPVHKGGARRIDHCWTEPLVGASSPARYGLAIAVPDRFPSLVPLCFCPRKRFFRIPATRRPKQTEAEELPTPKKPRGRPRKK